MHLVLNESISLPIGISFYTFQMISYIVDVYRDNEKCQHNFLNLGLYVTLFPQLIAGPIVRYSTIEKEISERHENFDDFASGICLFVRGLGKKALIADYLALISDNIFYLNKISKLSFISAWIGAVSYTLQIYFDFSGYSDMAIGLGRCFGFHFNVNFNQPYCAKSIHDFWRRWHISLTDWFRDYVYIPLGGNRCSKKRHITNIIIVWLLTGIWHGANWTFLVWGMIYCCFQLLERYIYNTSKWPSAFSRLYTLLIVCLSWVIFKSDSLKDAILYLSCMVNISNFADTTAIRYFNSSVLIIIVSILLCTPITTKLLDSNSFFLQFIKYIIFGIILILTTILSIGGGYSPFIYFNF